MKIKKRSIIQLIITLAVIINCIIYYLYINDYIGFKVLSIGELNSYGGWSALKSAFIDISYRWGGITKSIALTIAILTIALLFGRFFCGLICPIGALQDFFKFIGTRLNIKEVKLAMGKTFKPEMIKYIVLVLVLVLSVLGLDSLVSQYSPWLNFLNIFMGFNITKSIIVLILIMGISLFIKRAFCRCLCPLGAFQSLLSAIGPSDIRNSGSCDDCSYCLKDCPVDIDKPSEGEVSPECIRCMECTSEICIKGTEGYKPEFARFPLKRRSYIGICIVLLLSIYIGLPLLGSNMNQTTYAQLEDLTDGVYIGEGTGFGGVIQVEVKIDDKKIRDINVLDHNETTGYYEEVFKILSKNIIESQNLNVDAISGATTSSRGFLNAVRRGVSKSIEVK